MKKIVLALSVLLCASATMNAQISETFQGTFSQTLVADKIIELEPTEMPASEVAKFVMDKFFNGFDDFDTTFTDENRQVSVKQSFTIGGTMSVNFSEDRELEDSLLSKILEAVKDEFDIPIRTLDNTKFVAAEGLFSSVSANGDTKSTASYMYRDAEGNTYSEKDINLIITANSIEKVVASTGETLFLYSFKDSDIEQTENGFKVKNYLPFTSSIEINEEGELIYNDLGFIPMKLTRIADNKKSMTQTNDILLNIYPNPTRDVLNVSADEYIQRVELINMAGQTVYTTPVQDKQTQINTSAMESGSYILNIYTAKEKITKRVVLR